MKSRSYFKFIPIVFLTVAQILGMGGVVRSARGHSRATISRNLSNT